MSATRGLDFARQSVSLEPEFARGWSAVGRMASWAMRGASPAEGERFRREAVAAARKAISLDPANSQAYEVLAALEPRNSVVREQLHARSVAVRPGDCGCEHVGYGGFLAGVGRLSEALDQFERARDMVPTSVSVNASLAEGLFALGRNDEAARLIAPILELWPDDRQMHEAIVRTAFWTGRIEPALQSLANPATHFTSAEREAYASGLRALKSGGAARAAAARRLNELAAEPGGRRAMLITALAALGADREAMALATGLFGTDGSVEQFVLFEPALAATRRTPGFSALAERLGLVRYWKESRKPPEFCAARDAPAICAGLR
jgi:tetratricopeptide (TPR) repeat protein